ncbi:S1C family serine protease [Nesterenkonia populi]
MTEDPNGQRGDQRDDDGDYHYGHMEPARPTPGWGTPSGGYANAAHQEHDQQSAAPPLEQPAPAQHPVPAQTPAKERRGVGLFALLACTLVAALIGGGLVAGLLAFADRDAGDEAADGDEAVGEQTDDESAIEVNDPEDATIVTAAASEASPSVVTLAVAEEGGAGSGSGIVLDEEGHVLTNTHVVTLGGASADPNIQVQLYDGTSVDAEIVGTDPVSDLAVVQLEGAENLDLTPAELGSSGELNVGDRAIAIGAPLGLSGTVTDGIVSTLDRTITVASAEAEDPGADAPAEEGEDGEGFEFFFPDGEGDEEGEQAPPSTGGSIFLNVIQTDAAINQGNSGGALVDSEGRVIGVNVAIASSGAMFGEAGGNIGVGFAIPIDYAQRVAEDLIEHGSASHGQIGLMGTDASHDPEINQQILEADGSEPIMGGGAFTAGALVTEVMDGLPADEAGLQAGDVITEVEDRRIDGQLALSATIREFRGGETISLTVLRDGEEHEAEATLAEME